MKNTSTKKPGNQNVTPSLLESLSLLLSKEYTRQTLLFYSDYPFFKNGLFYFEKKSSQLA